MEPDTPDCPETYPPLPSSVITPKENKPSTGKFIILLILGSFLWSIIILGCIMGFIQLGYSDNFIPDHICNIRIENATNTSLTTGYLQGVYDTSQLVLTQGILPVFMEDGSLEYLNLTQDLNNMEE